MLRYQDFTEDELLHVAGEREHLTDEARLALESELSRRNLSTSDVSAYKRGCDDENETDELRRAREQVVPHFGLGKKFFGKTNCRRDPNDLFELCESTLWFAVLWFPVYPIATYTVRRDLERWLGMVLTSNEIAIDRHPRNWEMILLTWVKASALVLGLRLTFLLLQYHPEWLSHLLK